MSLLRAALSRPRSSLSLLARRCSPLPASSLPSLQATPPNIDAFRPPHASYRSFHQSPRRLKTTPFLLADIGEGIAEVELLQWFVSTGDSVKQFDKICEVQSDKATVEITSRYDGTVASLNGEVGDMMIVGEPLLELEVEGGGGSIEVSSGTPEDAQLSVPPAAPAAPAAGTAPPSKALTTPAVRKLAKENGIDLSTVKGSGGKGRVLKEDILALLGRAPPPGGAAGAVTAGGYAAAAPAPAAPKPAAPKPPKFQPPALPVQGDRREPIRGYARLMVQSMNASLSIPHFGYNDEIRLNSLSELRKALKPAAEERGVRMSYMPLFIKAASVALRSYPVVNSSVSADEKEIIYHGSHNVGVAMDTAQGLVVPNIKNCQNLSVFEIAAELNRLQHDGATSGIKAEDLAGTTFTLSNIGAIGGTTMVPVIAAPQVAIGALGKIQTLPRFGPGGEVERAMIMDISWAGDHRVVDGATMARFSNLWKDMLENPATMIAGLR
ncbi:hypothetical protein TeGR_g1856 [Tetraparma gracilis]|uniref:Dihydrolipoamide acetyltransferase component of pyruvate dehydrogenase complex n=1 Tax=Tetraparma gracilis TaxID=2962635 RepID=A0ABQ6N1B6_9STRA|nr:hypothetical protein TeGR_g1856 [Tetraparma gracilis]